MADEDLTDAELAAELKHYGEIIQLPIKSNKRQILFKKLNHLRARSGAQNSKQFPKSSPANSRNHSFRRSGDEYDPAPASNKTTVSSPHTSVDSRARQYSSALDSHKRPFILDEHGSDDSDEERVGNRSYTFKNNVGHISSNVSTRETRKRSTQLSDSVLRTLRRRTVEPPQGRTHKSGVLELSTEKNRSNNSLNEGSDEEIPVPSPARSRLYPDLNKITSFIPKSNDNKFESSDSDLDESTSTLRENKSNKFSNTSFSNAHTRADNTSHAGYISSVRSYLNSDSNSYQPRAHLLRRSYLNGHPRVQQYRSRYLEVLPQILIGVVVFFFIALFVTYVVIHKDFFFSWFSSSSNIGAGDHLFLCSDGISAEGCYAKEEVDKALKIIENLFEELSALKGRVLCDISRAPDDTMRVGVFKNQIGLSSVAVTTADRLYVCCLKHIMANPHWNIRALKEDGSPATDLSDVVKLQSQVAAMSFVCRLWRSFSTVLYGIFTLALVIAAFVLLSAYIKYRLKQRESEQKEVYTMVEKIIDYLQNHYEQTKNERSTELQYLAVQHVRDQLLPPSRRRKLQPIWDKAVKFIAANESRIKLESRIIQGDEFEVWHWLQPSIHNGKIWQGQAFGENSDNKGSNQVIYSPTPCLKIRNMFDSNVENEDNWEDSVTDAILEKCKNIDSIVHIYIDVDSREGCVYLKCSNCEAAGRARLALHGWWFDGRLVTVKHLKTDHYHKRWPEAREATKPLKPSTDQMRSLSQPYYRSSLEMT